MSNNVKEKQKNDAPKGKSNIKPKTAPKAVAKTTKPAAAPKTPPTAKAADNKSSDKPIKTPSTQPDKKSTVKERIIKMLSREDGATDAELVKEFDWKGNHVARGRRSHLAKEFKEKKKGIMIGKFTRTPSGDTAYKIEKLDEPVEQKKAA